MGRTARDPRAVRTPFVYALLAIAPTLGCEKFQATADRAMVSLQLKSECPDAVPGRAVGGDTPEAAAGCFRHAASEGSTSLMVRVTCRGRTPASCKQTDASNAEAERAMSELGKLSWKNVLGRWEEGSGERKTVVFAVDTKPGEKLTTTVTTCKIAEGDRWAVCEVGELSRTEVSARSR